MNFGLDLNLNVGLEQRLSPQMIQSLKLLQMNSMELDLVVKQELENNPLLEMTDDIDIEQKKDEKEGESDENGDDNPPEAPLAERATSPEEGSDPSPEINDGDLIIPETPEKSNEIDWESYLEEGFDHGSKHSEESESPDERFERVPVYAKTLQDHLLSQLIDRKISARILELVEYLIYSLDETGYLAAENQLIENASQVPSNQVGNISDEPEIRQIQAIIQGEMDLHLASKDVREAFHVLQGMDPAGVGARNLRECLLLQINRLPKFSELAKRIITEDFDLLEKLKIAVLAKKYELTPEQIQNSLKEIGILEPKPGRLVYSSPANTVIPDLIVEEVEGQLVLMLNDRSFPSLHISKAYADLLRKGSKARTEEKKFVRDKLNSATWLIRAIEQRKSTMLKVMHAIVETQPEFFTQGPTYLRPLILQDVADKISMHISTVSRVTNGKYVQTKHGIFELKYFFTAGVTQADGSEVSSVTAKEEIKRLIGSEDAKKPLSDQKIVEILKSKNLDVARRTVAKYRDQLEILPARLRKQY